MVFHIKWTEKSQNWGAPLGSQPALGCQPALKSRSFFLFSYKKSPKHLKSTKKVEIGQIKYFNQPSGVRINQKLVEIHNSLAFKITTLSFICFLWSKLLEIARAKCWDQKFPKKCFQLCSFPEYIKGRRDYQMPSKWPYSRRSWLDYNVINGRISLRTTVN